MTTQEETIQAKIRNKLTPFWNLIELINNADESGLKITINSKDVSCLIKNAAKTAESNKKELLELIDKTTI